MLITLSAAVMVMAAYFLLLYGGVGFIQDKRFFGSAHKDVLAVLPDKKPERFRGAHIVGWAIIAVSLLLFAGALGLSVWDGVKNNFSFWGFFGRFIAVLYIMEIYDILFFDWCLLCNSNFFPHFYPETKGIVGQHMFGYNKKQHFMHFIVYIPVCAVIAFICTFL